MFKGRFVSSAIIPTGLIFDSGGRFPNQRNSDSLPSAKGGGDGGNRDYAQGFDGKRIAGGFSEAALSDAAFEDDGRKLVRPGDLCVVESSPPSRNSTTSVVRVSELTC